MTMLEIKPIHTTFALTLACLAIGCTDDGKGSTAADEVGEADGTASEDDTASSESGSSTNTDTVDSSGTDTTADADDTSDVSDTSDASDDVDSSDDVDTNDTGTKFDVLEVTDLGETGGGIPGPGSCRPSEIYGAAGGFPIFEDPAYANYLDKTVAIVTHNTHGGGANNVITIVDISGDAPPPNMNYLAPRYWNPNWSQANLGKVFGLTLDSEGNIFVAATTVYGANPAPGSIKRIDHVTGEISNFATLPNNGPALGNINYDCVSQTIYASNHEDGRIYQIDMNGDVVSTYHHGTGDVTLGLAEDLGEPNGAFAPLGQRPWAVQSHAGRLYYSVWWEHSQAQHQTENNEVWSVAYEDDDGVPDASTAQKEFVIPSTQNGGISSTPVSDISLAATGWMLVAQRTMNGDTGTGAHQSTTYEYDYVNGQWEWQGTTYVVGELLPFSAAGGVDHDFDPNGYVWMTGDALDFYTPNVVYGLQGTPYGGGGIETSTLIDLDAEVVNQDKTVYGDVELPIPGDANPVPPPS
jgi:hypothetical protein